MYLFSDDCVLNALEIRKAVQQDNFHIFFRLYPSVPHLGKYILDLNLNQWRLQYLQRIVKAYKPQVEATFVLTELSLPLNPDGAEFLRKCGAVVVEGKLGEGMDYWWVNSKDSVIDASTVFTETNLL